MTGAGWGGCTVTLVEEEKAEKFVEAMVQEYYNRESNKQRV